MLKRLLFLVLLVVAIGLLAFFLRLGEDPGYLLLAWRNTTFESSLVAALLAIVVALLVLRLLYRLLMWLDPRPLLRRFRRAEDDGHTRSRTTKGLIGFFREDWEAAYRELELSFNDPDATVANYLAAAYAAQALGREELWTGCLDRAAKRFPGALSVIREARVELLCRNNQPGEASEVLDQLERTATGNKRLLALQKRLYLKLEDWDRLQSLLPRLEDKGLLDEEEGEQLERRIFVEKLSFLAEQAAALGGNETDRAEELLKVWDDARHRYHKDLDLVTRFVELLVKAGAAEDAALLIEATLPNTWHDPLIELYGAVDLGNPETRLIHAEDWLRERPNNPVLLLALGRIAMRNKAWLSAREYFETSCRLQPGVDVYGELARLLVSLGDEEAAQEYLLNYLRLSNSKLPELPLPEHRKKPAE
ncbi:MAG: heme biosynthesis HemY N-terminal domain-containing protein [Gammaproteobacteria bacterium]|nr:hypothetical protein [Pseudomonadales bacterium]MCP5347503.1 hypothetical protein [Pseudomonadales bacterium]